MTQRGWGLLLPPPSESESDSEKKVYPKSLPRRENPATPTDVMRLVWRSQMYISRTSPFPFHHQKRKQMSCPQPAQDRSPSPGTTMDPTTRIRSMRCSHVTYAMATSGLRAQALPICKDTCTLTTNGHTGPCAANCPGYISCAPEEPLLKTLPIVLKTESSSSSEPARKRRRKSAKPKQIVTPLPGIVLVEVSTGG